jgi:[acyl-carrier-protein] S-malonyltransferase
MDTATRSGDGLMFVRGLRREDIDRLCERHWAAVAIVNPGDAFVIGGGARRCRRLPGKPFRMIGPRPLAGTTQLQTVPADGRPLRRTLDER